MSASVPMSSSYKLVFIFSIVMTIVVFFVASATGSKNHVGTLIWGYSAWLMYKQKNEELVSYYKTLLWFTGGCAVLMLFLFAIYGDSLGYSPIGVFILFAIAIGIDFLLLKFFQNQLAQPNKKHLKDSSSRNATLNVSANEDLWEQASKEFNSTLRKEGMWAKCFAEADGDENKAKASYLKIRAQQLSDETLSDETLSVESAIKVDKPLSVNTKNINVSVLQNTVKLDGGAPYDKSLNYSDLSIKNLLENGLFRVEKYKNKDLLYLYSGNVGCVYGGLIKVFETEDFCKRAIKDELIGAKYPKGLVLTIRKDSFEIC